MPTRWLSVSHQVGKIFEILDFTRTLMAILAKIDADYSAFSQKHRIVGTDIAIVDRRLYSLRLRAAYMGKREMYCSLMQRY